MKKALLQKPIREVLYGIGFTHVKNDDYARLSNDGQVKLIVRIPDGNKGFIIGAQLADYGAFDGLLSHAQLRQYGFAYELAYASTKEYSDEEIISVANRLTKTCKQYIDGGLSALQNRVNEWTFGDTDERLRDQLLRLLGLPGIDPYSEDYRKNKANTLAGKGALTITYEEYLAHKDFYDGYEDYHGSIVVDKKRETVTIVFLLPGAES